MVEGSLLTCQICHFSSIVFKCLICSLNSLNLNQFDPTVNFIISSDNLVIKSFLHTKFLDFSVQSQQFKDIMKSFLTILSMEMAKLKIKSKAAMRPIIFFLKSGTTNFEPPPQEVRSGLQKQLQVILPNITAVRCNTMPHRKAASNPAQIDT